MKDDCFCMTRDVVEWCRSAKTAETFKERVLACAECALDGVLPKTYLPPDILKSLIAGVALADKERRSSIRKSTEYNEWRTAVFKRDNFTCQICGQVGRSLNAHHIKPFAKYPNDRFDVNNGVTLCLQCHKNVHRKRT